MISKASKPYGTDAQMVDSSFGWRFVNPKMESLYGTEAMGKTAENLAEMFNISREDQDAFAWQSEERFSRNAETDLPAVRVDWHKK